MPTRTYPETSSSYYLSSFMSRRPALPPVILHANYISDFPSFVLIRPVKQSMFVFVCEKLVLIILKNVFILLEVILVFLS